MSNLRVKRILEPADVIYDGARDNAASGTWYDWISCGDFITGEGHERHELYSLWVLVLFPRGAAALRRGSGWLQRHPG